MSDFNVYGQLSFQPKASMKRTKAKNDSETMRKVQIQSDTARRIRTRLYGKEHSKTENQIDEMLTPAQRQKLAKATVLNTLMDPNVFDQTEFREILSEWSTLNLKIDSSLSRKIFHESSIITTESIPSKKEFIIRIKL